MQKNISKKRSDIMKRSAKLGHCICDPKRKCPCDVFTKQSICPCAGEKPEPLNLSEIKLTQMVHNAGCASKISASDLELFLSNLPEIKDPNIISGVPNGDDAGIYKINDKVTLVQTVDVFTPCVDDPYTFGKICAANCLSDIYAMGGTPRTALSILAFPSETLDGQIMHLMLKGAIETLNKANCALIGGHSIKDNEIKLGFAITGTIESDKAAYLERAGVSDILVLTKPLGVGVLNFASQIGKANKKGLKQAEESMLSLNKAASVAMIKANVSACTDITGFGLFGHLIRMSRHSKVTAKIFANKLPAFEGVLELLKDGVIPGAIERNREFVSDDLIIEEGVKEEYVNLGFGAETSGGLLICVPVDRFKILIEELNFRGIIPAVIGEITGKSKGIIELVNKENKSESQIKNIIMSASKNTSKKSCCCENDITNNK